MTRTISIAVVLCLAAAPTLAHHSRAMFDMSTNVTYRGVVQEYRWQNPHSQIVVTVGADTWTVEASDIKLMTTRGWTRVTWPG